MSENEKTRTSWHLARLAECSDPDRHDGYGFAPPFDAPDGYEPSPGARFLRGVEDDTLEALTDGRWDDDGDAAHEIADSAVPVYTHERWATFVDLGAYNEDARELGADADDMTAAAGVCLYIIAERLARAIAEDAKNDDETDEENEQRMRRT